MQIGPIELYEHSSFSVSALSQATAARSPAEIPELSNAAQSPPRSSLSAAVVVRLSAPQAAAGGSTGDKSATTSRGSSREQKQGELSEEEQRIVERLKARDREVRAHEQAHQSRLGPYARGGAQFEYETGPDNKQYAVGGEVGVDLSPEDDPEKTVLKMQTIKAAANAPEEPSSADKQVAAQAQAIEQQARAEIQEKEIRTEIGEGIEPVPPTGIDRLAATSSSDSSRSARSDGIHGLDGGDRLEDEFERRPRLDIYV